MNKKKSKKSQKKKSTAQTPNTQPPVNMLGIEGSPSDEMTKEIIEEYAAKQKKETRKFKLG